MRPNFAKAATVAIIMVGSIGISGCATKGYVPREIATVNQRIDGIDGRVRTVEGTSGQALTQAQAADGLAQQNAQRIDQIYGRVDGLDQQMQQQAQRQQRRPRG